MSFSSEPVYGRLEAMKSLLLWEGRLKRSRLMSLFGIKKTRASQWINEFNEEYPKWSEWSDLTSSHHATTKAYKQSSISSLSASMPDSPLERYLTITNSPTNTNTGGESIVIWDAFPELSTPKAEIFSKIYEAITDGLCVETSYRSLSNPEPHIRTLSPHSIVRTGRRWHVRAYCKETQDFRDFNLGRFVSIQSSDQPCIKKSEDDQAWMTKVKIELIAHPGLTENQQDMIREEYFAGVASRIEYCRGCLVPYFIKDLHATVNPTRDTAPTWLLSVANPEDLMEWLIP